MLVEIRIDIDLSGREVNLSIISAINDVINRVCIHYFSEKNYPSKKLSS